MADHQACRTILSPPSPPPRPLQGPSRWAQQVLFTLKAVHFEFAEPLMSSAHPSSPMWSRVLFSLETSSFQAGRTVWPLTQGCKPQVTCSRMETVRFECLPATCDLCWDPLLAPEHVRSRAGQTLWLNDLKGRQVDSQRSPQQWKFSQPILQQMNNKSQS